MTDTLFDTEPESGSDPHETADCPACGSPGAIVRPRPDTVHHAELRCPRCRHFRWLPKPPTDNTPERTIMPRVSDMFPSKYLKAADAEDEDLTLTINAIKEESLGKGRDAEDKWVLYFEEHEKGLVLNKTNMNIIAKLYGDDTDEWIGKPVTLYATEVQFQDEMVGAIRIRSKPARKPKVAAPAPKGKAAKAPAAGTDEDDESPF